MQRASLLVRSSWFSVRLLCFVASPIGADAGVRPGRARGRPSLQPVRASRTWQAPGPPAPLNSCGQGPQRLALTHLLPGRRDWKAARGLLGGPVQPGPLGLQIAAGSVTGLRLWAGGFPQLSCIFGGFSLWVEGNEVRCCWPVRPRAGLPASPPSQWASPTPSPIT